MSIQVTITRTPARDEALVLAAFSYRDDAALVPGLLANVAPLTHGWIAWDDRADPAWRSSDRQRHGALLRAIRQHGADWVLLLDPDERLEDAAAAQFPGLVAAPDRPVWTFALHEMFTPDSYRTDGIWGGRRRRRLLPVTDDLALPDAAFHAEAAFVHRAGRPLRSSGLAIYHLRMISAERRRLRRDHYALLDPARRFQDIGYDYLTMEEGARYEPVPPGRGFSPPFVEDGALWAAPLPADAPPPPPDPLACRLRFVQASRNRAAPVAADAALRAALEHDPDDADLHILRAETALAAEGPGGGSWQDALDRAAALAPEAAVVPLIRARARLRGGDRDGALAALGAAQALAPGSLVLGQLDDEARRDPQARARPGALWRRWVTGAAHLCEGAEVPGVAPIAVVVIAFRAQPGVGAAVRSILEQDGPAAEVVVVNSGGGDIASALGPLLPRVRLIDLAEPHRVGAARNVGIDASSAPVLAFLAADCLAAPGWIRRRLHHHTAGAAAVASAIVPAHPGNPVSWVDSACSLGRRWPGTAEDRADRYGLSYARGIFDRLGYFATGLQGGEDTLLNRQVSARHGALWDPCIVTAHGDRTDALALCRDAARRHVWKARHVPVWRRLDPQDRDPALDDFRRGVLRDAQGALAAIAGPSTDARTLRLIALVARARVTGLRRGLAAIDEAARLGAEAAGAMARGDHAGAAVLLDQAIALDYAPAVRHRQLAQALAGAGDWGGAREAALRGLGIVPGDVELARLACEAEAKAGHPGRALPLAERIALGAPAVAGLWALASRLARRRRQPGRALLNAHLAFLADPSPGRAHRALAQAWEMAGVPAQAARRGALAADPG